MTTTDGDRPVLDLKPGQHGTAYGYRVGCRCDWCTEAKADEAYALYLVRKARGLPPDDPRHGTVTGYNNWGCRCEPCRAARKAQSADQRRRGLPPGDPRHGTVNGYNNLGCRCDPCRAAKAVSNAEQRARRKGGGGDHHRTVDMSGGNV